MNLNRLSELGFDELNLVRDAVDLELARRFKQFKVGQSVRVVEVDNDKHLPLIGKTGRVARAINRENMYEVNLYQQTATGDRAGVWMETYWFLPNEIELHGDGKILPPEFSRVNYSADFSILDEYAVM